MFYSEFCLAGSKCTFDRFLIKLFVILMVLQSLRLDIVLQAFFTVVMATTTVFAQDYFLILDIHFVCTNNAEM
jgi:hypothetical protein